MTPRRGTILCTVVFFEFQQGINEYELDLSFVWWISQIAVLLQRGGVDAIVDLTWSFVMNTK